MRFSFLAFGLCVGMAVCSFIDKEISTGVIQILCACINLPGMLSTKGD
jgi:hypothetical protein